MAGRVDGWLTTHPLSSPARARRSALTHAPQHRVRRHLRCRCTAAREGGFTTASRRINSVGRFERRFVRRFSLGRERQRVFFAKTRHVLLLFPRTVYITIYTHTRFATSYDLKNLSFRGRKQSILPVLEKMLIRNVNFRPFFSERNFGFARDT